uniref:Uncharacterized protein n=1 Tax=Glossina austeni TaxID=7395 RepID=A0A1A9VUN4_GLOAU
MGHTSHKRSTANMFEEQLVKATNEQDLVWKQKKKENENVAETKFDLGFNNNEHGALPAPTGKSLLSDTYTTGRRPVTHAGTLEGQIDKQRFPCLATRRRRHLKDFIDASGSR